MRKLTLFLLILLASPMFGQKKIDLANQVAGILPVANGGLGTTTTPGTFIYWNGSFWVYFPGNSSGTNVIQENASGVPSWVPNAGGGSAGAEIQYTSYCAADTNYSTDDSTCWQNAVNALTSPGQTLVVPFGKYKIVTGFTHSGVGFHVRGVGTAGGGPGGTLSTVTLGCFTSNIAVLTLGTPTTSNYNGAQLDNLTFSDQTGGTCAIGLASYNQSYLTTHNVGYSGFTETGVTPPTTPALTPSSSGGSLAAQVWYVLTTFTDSLLRETPFQTPTATTVGGSGSGSIAVASLTAVSPMTAYNVYLCTSTTIGTCHLVKQGATSGSGYTITANAPSGVHPPATNESGGLGILTIGTSGGLSALTTGYANQNSFYDTQVYNGTYDGIVAERNVSGTIIIGGNINQGSNTSGAGLIIGNPEMVIMHTESGYAGAVRAVITGPTGEIHLTADIGSGTQTGIQAVNAQNWFIWGNCAAGGSNALTLLTLDAGSGGNEVHLKDNGTCVHPLYTDANGTNQIYPILNGAQYSPLFLSTPTSAGYITPPVTKGTYVLGFNLSTDAAAAPVASLTGLSSRSVAGSSDTVLFSDNLHLVEYAYSGAVAVTLPTPTTLENSYFATQIVNLSATSTTVTVTPTTWTINGGSTLAIAQDELCTVYTSPASGSAWHAVCHTLSHHP